jgi:excisionase family DNA binding protein
MDGLLTVTEVSKILKIHTKTVWRLIRAKRLRAIDIGVGRQLRYRIRREDLDDFLKQEAVESK